MNKPTDKQIKEFLQWCDIQCYYKDEVNENIEAWICPPDSEKTIAFYGLTLDFLFKYAVPKADGLGYYVTLKSHVYGKDLGKNPEYAASVYEGKEQYSENPALALFWALWQVKENEILLSR